MKLFERVSPDAALIGIIVSIVILTRALSFINLDSLASQNPEAYPYPVVAGDSSYYARWADNLLAYGAYQDPPGTPLRAAPPGYPALLAGIKAATGSMTPVIIAQIILAAYAAVLVFKMSRSIVPRAYAAVPAFIYAIDPMAVFTDSAVMTDGLFTSLLICIVYFAFFQSRITGVARWGLVGLFLGAATMLRPIAQFLVIVFPALYLAREFMSGHYRDGSRWKSVCAFAIGFALVVSPWILRNYIQFGSFEISPLGGHNLLTFNVRGYLAWRALSDTTESLPAILVLRHANDPVFSSVEKEMRKRLAEITPPGENPDNYEGRLAVEYIMRDPLRYAYFHAVNTAPFFLSSSIANYRQIARQLGANEEFYAPAMLSLIGSLQRMRHPESIADFLSAARSVGPVALEVAWWAIVSVLALAALSLWRKNFSVLLFAVLVAYFAALTGPMSMSRYRIPAAPYLLILAAAGTRAIVDRAKGKTRADSPALPRTPSSS